MDLTDKEYQVMLNLFHEFHSAFCALPVTYKDAFYKRLYDKR